MGPAEGQVQAIEVFLRQPQRAAGQRGRAHCWCDSLPEWITCNLRDCIGLGCGQLSSWIGLQVSNLLFQFSVRQVKLATSYCTFGEMKSLSLKIKQCCSQQEKMDTILLLTDTTLAHQTEGISTDCPSIFVFIICSFVSSSCNIYIKKDSVLYVNLSNLQTEKHMKLFLKKKHNTLLFRHIRLKKIICWYEFL